MTWQKRRTPTRARHEKEEVIFVDPSTHDNHIVVQDAAEDRELATVKDINRMVWNADAKIRFADGRSYALKKLSLVKNDWGLTDWNGLMVFSIHDKHLLLRETAEVHLDPFLGGQSPNFPLLLIIAFFALLSMHERQAISLAHFP